MFSQYKLPNELCLHVFSFLRPKDLCLIAQVNKEIKELSYDNQIWSQFLKENSKKINESDKEICKQYYLKIIKDFAITTSELNSLHYPLYFDQLYARFQRLNKYFSLYKDDVRRETYTDKANQSLILKCCTDDLIYLADLFETQENYTRYHLLDMTVISGCINLSKALFNKIIIMEDDVNTMASYCLELASEVGNLEMARFLFENYHELIVTEDVLNKTASSGCVELIKLLLNKNPDLKPTQTTFDCAASSGNINALILLRDLNSSLEFSLFTLECAVTAISNSEMMTAYIFDQNKELIPNDGTLHHAAYSGSVELIKILLDRNPALQPDHETFVNAEDGKNQDLLTFLNENYFNLRNYQPW